MIKVSESNKVSKPDSMPSWDKHPTTRKVRLRWTDSRGYRHSRTFGSRKEGERFYKIHVRTEEEEGRARRARGRAYGKSLSLVDVSRRFLDASAMGRSGAAPLEPSTLRSYEDFHRRFVLVHLGDYWANRLEKEHGTEIVELALQHAVSRDQASRWVRYVLTVMNWALRDVKEVTSNPISHIRIAKDYRDRPMKAARKTFTRAEMLKLMEVAKSIYEGQRGTPRQVKGYKRYYPLFLILVGTGMRISEALGLKWSDFTEDLGLVTVSRKARQNIRGVTQATRMGRVKSAYAHRTLPVPASVVEVLRDWSKAPDRGEFVFSTKQGTVMTYDAVRGQFWKPLISEAEVPDHGIHATRHFHASLMLEQGQIALLSRLLGHHSIAFTMSVYADLIGDEDEQRASVRAAVEGLFVQSEEA